MDEKTKKLIKEKFDALPKSIQEVILSSNYENSLLEIGQQYKLNVEQLGVLERETTLVMMGLIPTKDFENELTQELGVEKEKGTQITKDINEKIFIRIRELLKIMNTPIEENIPVEESPQKIEQKKNTENEQDMIMRGAGIEIEKNGFTNTENGASNKLLDSVKIPVIHTDHSLTNITPSTNLKTNTGAPSKLMTDIKKVTPVTPKIDSYSKNKDPYRLSPDE